MGVVWRPKPQDRWVFLLIFFHVLFLCLLLCIGIFVFLILEVLISGFVVKVFRIRYEEGEYNVTLYDKNVFKFTLFYSIYFFPLNLVELFGFVYLKTVFLKLVGLKLGKNSVLGSKGVFISDPCLTEIGSGTRIGSFSTFTSHVIEGERMFIKKIKVGNNCLIGGETSLLPGVVVGDNVVLGAKSLVLKNQVLKNGRVYGGIPARELKPSKDIIKRN